MRHDLATFLRDIARGDQLEPAVLSKRARDLLAGKPPPGTPKRKPIPKPPLPGLSREERRAAHNASTKSLRTFVLARSGGFCEACRYEFGTAWHMHHVEAAGLRRSRQRESNVLALCMDCHRRAHRGDLGTLAQIAQAPSLDAEAERAALHRVAKIEEARAQHPEAR